LGRVPQGLELITKFYCKLAVVFRPIFWFSIKSFFDENFDFLWKFRFCIKISILYENFDFVWKFRFLMNISILGENFNFWWKSWFPVKISIFLIKISIFDLNFDKFLTKNRSKCRFLWTPISKLESQYWNTFFVSLTQIIKLFLWKWFETF